MKGKIELSRLFQSAGGFPLHGQAGEFQIGFRVRTDGFRFLPRPHRQSWGLTPGVVGGPTVEPPLAPIEFQLPLFSV